MLLVEAVRAVLPGGILEGPIYVLVDGKNIVSVQRERPATIEGIVEKHAHLITPGFVDIHTHGLGEIATVNSCELYMYERAYCLHFRRRSRRA